MKRRIIIIMHNDLMDYPPMISLIDVLHDLNEDITYIGGYTDSPTTERFVSNGINLIRLSCEKKGSLINKIITFYNYNRKLCLLLKELKINNEKDIIWYVYSDSANFVYKTLAKYKYVIHYYEYVSQSNWKFKLLSPFYNQMHFAQKAIGVIQCEYDRAEIFRALNELNESPYVIPNKPYLKEQSMVESKIPNDIKNIIEEVKNKVVQKKVILYQGYFDSKERKLEEFCEAIIKMPSEYVMIAMGKGPDESYAKLKAKYESDKILFVPFILPPFHLNITQLASVGVLSYSPQVRTHAGVINSLFCAPNKIFEYGRFGKPMISNNVPGLNSIFKLYHCGLTINYPITPEAIVSTIKSLYADYDYFSKGAKLYYDSVDLIGIIKGIIEDITQKHYSNGHQ